MQIKVTISNQCDEKEFLNAVRINGLLKYNLNKTSGKLKEPDIEIVSSGSERSSFSTVS